MSRVVPAIELSLLRHLIDIRSALRDAKEDVSHALQTAIDKTAPMVRFFRHGDGGLALFNGSDEDEGWLIDGRAVEIRGAGEAARICTT